MLSVPAQSSPIDITASVPTTRRLSSASSIMTINENRGGNGMDGDVCDDNLDMFDVTNDLGSGTDGDFLTDNFSDPFLAAMAAHTATAGDGDAEGSTHSLDFLGDESSNSLFDKFITDEITVMPVVASSSGGNAQQAQQQQQQQQPATVSLHTQTSDASGVASGEMADIEPNSISSFMNPPSEMNNIQNNNLRQAPRNSGPTSVPEDVSMSNLDEDGDVLSSLTRTPSFHPVDGSPPSRAWEGVSLPRDPSRTGIISSGLSSSRTAAQSGNANASFGQNASFGGGDATGLRRTGGAAGVGRMMLNPMFDAKPLDISLGDSGMLVGRAGDGASNSSNSNLLAAKMRQKKNPHTSKGSLLPTGRMSSVVKANMSAVRLRSTMSDGMLARAMKARHSSQPGNIQSLARNGGMHNPMASSRFARTAISSANVRTMGMTNHRSNAAMPISRSRLFGSVSRNLDEVELEESSAQGRNNNVSWGAPPAKRVTASSSLFSGIISGSSSNISAHLKSKAAANSSSSSLRGMDTDQSQLTSMSSSSSIQDMLRTSKQQTKNQTLLRQSSAQSLMRQSSSQSLKAMPKRLDVAALLRPNHTSPQGRSKNVLPAGTATGIPNFNQMMESSSLLHQSCRLYPTTTAVVESALRADPSAVRRSVPISSDEKRETKLKSQTVYTYPINIAIRHGGSMEVLRLLAQAGPDVLAMKDGTDLAGSLSVALLQKCGKPVIDMLMDINPSCVSVMDRRANYPLHTAVSNGASLEVVERLYNAFPDAIEMRNFHSETPLDIAQRSTMSPEEVTNFLQHNAYSSAETEAHHAVPNERDQNGG